MNPRLFWPLWFGGMGTMWLVMVRDAVTAVQCAVLTIPITFLLIRSEWRDGALTGRGDPPQLDGH